MINMVTMVLVLLEGLLLGGFFFGGLLWTVRLGISAKHPSYWFLGSSLIRMTIVLGAFYFVSRGGWEDMLICLAGFLITRVILIRCTSRQVKSGVDRKEATDAT